MRGSTAWSRSIITPRRLGGRGHRYANERFTLVGLRRKGRRVAGPNRIGPGIHQGQQEQNGKDHVDQDKRGEKPHHSTKLAIVLRRDHTAENFGSRRGGIDGNQLRVGIHDFIKR